MDITIVEYDASWPDRFAGIATGLREHLGDKAVRIDHIGSTSVPGLAAKDIIDLMVTVADLDDSTLEKAVEAAGFSWRRDIDHDHQPPGRDLPAAELRKRYAQRPGANCHIRQADRFNQRYGLLCRDYLRAHPQSAKAYEEIKRELAVHFGADVEGYYDIKDPVFDIIMEGAYAWADTTAWQPEPSDA